MKRKNQPAFILLVLSVLSMALGVACSDKRGFRSRRPIVDPTQIQERAADPQDTETPTSEAPEMEQEGPETQEEGADPAESETQSAELEDGGENTESELDRPAEIIEDRSAEDEQLVEDAAEMFTAQILGQEVTPDLIAQAVQQFNPEMARSIIGLSVTKTVAQAAEDGQAGIYDLAIDLGLRWADNENQEHLDHLISAMQVQYPHQNGTGVVEAQVRFAQELDAEDGGVVENILAYASCIAENCSEVLVLIRISSPSQQDGQVIERLVAYKFRNYEGSAAMQIVATSVGTANFRYFEDVREEILASQAEAQTETEEVQEEAALQEEEAPALAGPESAAPEAAEQAAGGAETQADGENAEESEDESAAAEETEAASAEEVSGEGDAAVEVLDNDAQEVRLPTGPEEQPLAGDEEEVDGILANDQRHFGNSDPNTYPGASQTVEGESEDADVQEEEQGWWEWATGWIWSSDDQSEAGPEALDEEEASTQGSGMEGVPPEAMVP